MATKRKKTNKFGITPSVIFLNLTVIMFLVIVCFFAYNVIKEDEIQTSSEPPFTAVTDKPVTSAPQSAPETESSNESMTSQDSDSSSSTESNSSDSTETSDTESSSVENSEDTSSEGEVQDTYFDREFFDDALFIGDSISTGLSLYGFLDEENVFATQGLAPSTVLTIEIDGKTFSDKITSFKPEKIFIMLGTNSVGYADAADLVDSMKTLVNDITSTCKSKVYVLSIPPVTKDAEADQSNYLTKEAINEYNNKLKAVVEGTKAEFIDFNAMLSDSDGYFNEDYAEMDGIHFMGSTYQVMLSYLQKQTS